MCVRCWCRGLRESPYISPAAGRNPAKIRMIWAQISKFPSVYLEYFCEISRKGYSPIVRGPSVVWFLTRGVLVVLRIWGGHLPDLEGDARLMTGEHIAGTSRLGHFDGSTQGQLCERTMQGRLDVLYKLCRVSGLPYSPPPLLDQASSLRSADYSAPALVCL